MDNEAAAKMAFAITKWARDITLPRVLEAKTLNREQFEIYARATVEGMDDLLESGRDAIDWRTADVDDLLVKAIWRAMWHNYFKLNVHGGDQPHGTA